VTSPPAPGVDIAKALAKFKVLDICPAEDNLGSGHSSLTQLRMLPFDSVKIDRSIVALADEDRSNVLRFIYQLSRRPFDRQDRGGRGRRDDGPARAIAILGADLIVAAALRKRRRMDGSVGE